MDALGYAAADRPAVRQLVRRFLLTAVGDDVVTRVATGAMPDGIVAAYGSLWVANYGSDTVTRVDPVQRRVLATVAVAAGPISLADADGAIWVAGYDSGVVTRIDAQTNR